MTKQRIFTEHTLTLNCKSCNEFMRLLYPLNHRKPVILYCPHCRHIKQSTIETIADELAK
jgi:hypothetical protein